MAIMKEGKMLCTEKGRKKEEVKIKVSFRHPRASLKEIYFAYSKFYRFIIS